jgi:hypothetical protein
VPKHLPTPQRYSLTAHESHDQDPIEAKIKVLLQMSLVLIWGMRGTDEG